LDSRKGIQRTLWSRPIDVKKPATRDDPPAIILRAPESFTVQDLGTSSLASAAAVLMQATGSREFESSRNAAAECSLGLAPQAKIFRASGAPVGTSTLPIIALGTNAFVIGSDSPFDSSDSLRMTGFWGDHPNRLSSSILDSVRLPQNKPAPDLKTIHQRAEGEP
jgi:hypothetical protein